LSLVTLHDHPADGQAETHAAWLRGDEGIEDAVRRPWRSEIVEGLRRLCVRLKAGPGPAPSSRTEPLRQRIKAAELKAEQIECSILAEWLDRRSPDERIPPRGVWKAPDLLKTEPAATFECALYSIRWSNGSSRSSLRSPS